MLTMRLPDTAKSPSRRKPGQLHKLRRDLMLGGMNERPQFYGQLVDMEWQRFEVAVSDSASSFIRADDSADA